MRAPILLIALAFASAASAKQHDDYQRGTLLRMDSSTCGTQEKGSKSLTGEILGTDAQKRNTKEVLCQEYVLQSDHVVYRIRPRDDKHAVLLPLGETAQFRIHKDKLVLRVPEADGKEREYSVLSMTPRQEKDAPSQAASIN
jgi:hypothetical protein